MAERGRGSGVRMPPEKRRAQVIDAATALIGERGYWGVSIHDIAAACGITDAGLLHHFPRKERLLIAVMESRDEADRRALAEALGVSRDQLASAMARTELGALCMAMVERNARQPEIVRLYTVLSAESLAPPHPAHAYFYARERTAIAALASARQPSPGDAEARARLVLAAMDGLQVRWLRDPQSLDLAEEWTRMADALLAPGD